MLLRFRQLHTVDWTEPFEAPISEKSYMVGCAMGGGRILRQMEILVSGQVVLCCDDASGKTNYGNVFELGIEQTWKNLQKEHEIIYNTKYSNEKKNLICNTCSRGKFKGYWTEKMEKKLLTRQHKAINNIGAMNVIK